MEIEGCPYSENCSKVIDYEAGLRKLGVKPSKPEKIMTLDYATGAQASRVFKLLKAARRELRDDLDACPVCPVKKKG